MDTPINRCVNCECELSESDAHIFDDEYYCEDCLHDETFLCDRCGERHSQDDRYGGDDRDLCEHCYYEHYYRCDGCGRIIPKIDAYYLGDDTDCDSPYCYECYQERKAKYTYIHDYSYKPIPLFYGDGTRYFGVELEIDDGGDDCYNAEAILEIANESAEHLYCKCKHDGSIENGFEMVTHPMSLDYHINKMPWSAVLKSAVSMGYLSHNTSTCGLHIHVSRDAIGEFTTQQEACIARILYFVENHWQELLKFSRRTQYQLDQWASRYGRANSPKEALDTAKKAVKVGTLASIFKIIRRLSLGFSKVHCYIQH